MCTTDRDLLHNRWSLVATGDQPKRDEINASGPPGGNMPGFRQSNKQVHTAFHTRVLLGEFPHTKSSITWDINLYCSSLKNKSGLSPCRQGGFSSTARLAGSLKFFQSSSKVQKNYGMSPTDNEKNTPQNATPDYGQNKSQP